MVPLEVEVLERNGIKSRAWKRRELCRVELGWFGVDHHSPPAASAA
jgi:hypothetical protein